MQTIEAGRPLAARIRERMALNGHSVSELGRLLGVSQAYLSQLLKGDRQFATVGDDSLRAIAAYLGLPAMICFLLAGKVHTEDFVLPSVELERSLERALTFVADSSYALESGVDLAVLRGAPHQLQTLVVFLYQSAAKARVYPLEEDWSLLRRSL